MPLTAGTRLGVYDILAPLGAGGMGEVYRATDSRLKRQVAIKILPPAVAADPDRLARFQREAEVLASLNHPYIAAVYGLEDAAGGKALVMELVEGPTLADRIAQGRIPIDEALSIARQIAEALEAAHEQGIIHRDLKAANIKVRQDGTVKALDFGLAKLTTGPKTGTLLAVPFDLRSLQLTGTPVALIEGVMQSVNTPNTDDETGAGQFAVSTSGTLLYVAGGISPTSEGSLVWGDRTGVTTPLANASAGSYSNPRLSPDGQKIAVATIAGPAAGESRDVWVHDALRGAPTRLTFDGGNLPVWSPDGKRIGYGRDGLYVINADGSGKPERLTSGGDTPSSWASPANVIVFLQKTQNGSNGIWVLPMEGSGKPRLFIESRFELWHPDLSPDGRWMAYVSFESGTPELYVQPYPGPGEKIRVSTAGGFDPIWTRTGRELLYRSGTLESHQVFSAVIRSLSPFRTDPPRLVFENKAGEYDSTAPERSWDVSADGQRFLFLKPVATTDKPVTVMHVVLNWAEELQRLVPVK